MSEDNELFELCKQVYFTTYWNNNEKRLSTGRPGTFIPLYTSDYLLEKLPRDTALFKTILVADEHRYYANSAKALDSNCYSDSPLKALLKLTLALHEAGELHER